MDSSFSSTGSHSALHHDAHRVNRFLSRHNNDDKKKSPKSSPTLRISPIPGLKTLSACSSSESLLNLSFQQQSPVQKTYVIEGIHGPVATDKVPNGVSSRRRDPKRTRLKFKRYVAAKQSERAKKFSSMEGDDSPNHNQATTEMKMSDYAAFYPRSNNSPTTVAADISFVTNDDKKCNRSRQELDNAFISLESPPLKSSFNKHVGMIPKKNLTWWDDKVNAHKPFTLRSDDIWDEESCDDTTSYRERHILFGTSGCPHDNLKDLIEDYGDRLKSTVVDLFQVKRIGNKAMFRDNFASFSEDLVDDDVGEKGGCAGPSRQLIQVVKNIMPPVCEFETFETHNEVHEF